MAFSKTRVNLQSNKTKMGEIGPILTKLWPFEYFSFFIRNHEEFEKVMVLNELKA